MRAAPSFVTCLLLFSLAHNAYAASSDDEQGGSSLMVEAGSTGAILFSPSDLHQQMERCDEDHNQRYRTADGMCNHPFNLGSAHHPFRRFLTPLYGNGVSSPRTHGKGGFPLPSATEVSRIIHTDASDATDYTVMLMQWGQFTDHDLALTPVHKSDEGRLRCCGIHLEHKDCFPIFLSKEDTNKRFVGHCMNFIRSMSALDEGDDDDDGDDKEKILPREQINQLTAFLDGSNIYGSSREKQLRLRETNSNGKPGAEMKTGPNNLLPNNTRSQSCRARSKDYCFEAGDSRVNVQPGLMAIHTMWVRFHNWVVDQLRDVLPKNSDDEELFQEARKVVVAIYQMIHYNEWLPLILGPILHDRYHLFPDTRFGKRSGYSSLVDPRVVNEFATAAYRFGHSTIPDHLVINGKAHLFRTMFFDPSVIFDSGYNAVMESLLNTDSGSRAQVADRFISSELQSHLFEPPGQSGHGLDLPALNIQRGRDHGLRPFNDYRKACGLDPIKKFSEFGKIGEKLQELYKDVDNIDLFVGGLLEEKKPGSKGEHPPMVGPTFGCIIAQQFQALKFGDLFYFETDRQPGRFTDGQLNDIRKWKFYHVVCLTTGLREVPEDIFLGQRPKNCAEALKELNFSNW